MQNSPQHQAPTEQDNEGATKPGLPMRGLAMILIAVAVLLAAWALWSMQSGSDSSSTSAQTETTQTQAGTTDTSGSATGVDSATSSAASGTASGAAEAPAPGGNDAAVSSMAPEATAGSGAGADVNTLYVLNNSTVPQLAARVADSLNGDYDRVESGNLPDTVIPENTVYFTPGNAQAEQAARELADRVGGVAMERSDVLPPETEGNDAIVLVLVQDVAL
ncbi:hypothetical protein CDES_12325 [Corynebacterium deserti GIMN1.010]|uniref:LytR/CpsA/Psr regulator C-terminal domain-containing protein n=2 Tax=Corynebacterium TaxID=1716 RepID=A0A0M3QA73_9CORY|nr:hypothetical protein CDES_12325 [Corynebacterium deserti GIMN1.010]